MQYFVTGGTGFIGRFLVPKLLDRGGIVYLLVRESSLDKIETLRALWGVSKKQVIPVVGDLSKGKLGIGKKDLDSLKGNIDHFFHLAAIYDISADAESQRVANVEGTRNAMGAARAMKAGCFHHTSSIAAGGLYDGEFTEDMFEEATGLDNPYFLTKHESEGVVRNSRGLKYRIYRPAAVVGHSQTGEIDKIDGPYYFFKAIAAAGKAIPSWLPLFTMKGGNLNVVPVDYVVAAMDAIAHTPGQDGKVFHLTADKSYSVGDTMALFLKQAHGPNMRTLELPAVAKLSKKLPINSIIKRQPAKGAISMFMKEMQIPVELLDMLDYPTTYDNSNTHEVLDPLGIVCPPLEHYAPAIWEYWQRNLRSPGRADRLLGVVEQWRRQVLPAKSNKQLVKAVKGKVVVVTGSTSGIGLKCAHRLADAGATVVLAARTIEKLEETLEEIKARGGKAVAYSVDISDMDSCDRFVERVNTELDGADILINNAGRSIRRSVENSFDRYHDFERTMQLNYFGALRLIFGLAPGMLERRSGHIINISSIGVLASPPRFSAYVASKAALDAFSACAAAEFADRKVRFTTINMPLVRTPMIAPTKLYNAFPTLSPDEAGDLVMKAIVQKPKRVATPAGIMGAMTQALTPDLTELILNQAYHVFPDSMAAKGDGADGDDKKSKSMDFSNRPSVTAGDSLEVAQRVFAYFFRGIHW